MNSTIIQVCKTHVPNNSAKSFHNDVCYTFCEECENNIESFYIDAESDRLGRWSNWSVSK
jgi:hypothetical protein